MPEIISRKEARARGLTQYFTGEPCKHGHISKRRVNTRTCMACSNLTHKEYTKSNSGKINKQRRINWAKNRQKTNEARRTRLDKDRKSYNQNAYNWRVKNPGKYAAILERRRNNTEYKKRQREKRRKERVAIADLIAVLRVEMPEILKEFGL